MVKYLIIEDELLAYQEIKRMIDDLRPTFQMAGWAQSVAQGIALLHSETFDLIISDISLSDGQCFEIFDEIETDIPIIFTTAYDEYAIRAFKVNGIDYLLKPIEKETLEMALKKFERHAIHSTAQLPKSRFLIQHGDSFLYVETIEAACFYSEDKYTYIHLFSGKRYIVDYSLDTLESMLDNSIFFRISRNCIVNIKNIKRFSRYFSGRIKLNCQVPEELFVSRSKAKDFLKWMDGML